MLNICFADNIILCCIALADFAYSSFQYINNCNFCYNIGMLINKYKFKISSLFRY